MSEVSRRKVATEMAATSATVQASKPLPSASSPSPSSPSPRLVPTYNWRAHWLTVTEFSRMMGRRPSTVYEWVEDGTLAEFGFPVREFRYGRRHSGRVFIQNIC